MTSDTYDTMPAMLADSIRLATLGLLFALAGIAVPDRWTAFFILSFFSVIAAVVCLTIDWQRSRHEDQQ